MCAIRYDMHENGVSVHRRYVCKAKGRGRDGAELNHRTQSVKHTKCGTHTTTPNDTKLEHAVRGSPYTPCGGVGVVLRGLGDRGEGGSVGDAAARLEQADCRQRGHILLNSSV